MAKKSNDGENPSKSIKRTVTPSVKRVARPMQTKSTATRKPAATPKPPATPKPRNAENKKSLQAEDNNYVVTGRVTYPDSTPATGLSVIAYDKDVSGKDTLGQAITDKSGAYQIRYGDADFRRTKKERGGADVIVSVYNDKQELLFTSKKQNDAPAEYVLNITMPAAPFVIRGKVTGAIQQPLANMIVRADWRDLRHPYRIGSAATDTNGEYRIEYHPADLLLSDTTKRSAPWIIVEVLETSDGAVLARQEVQKAARDQHISFTLAHLGAVSEWQRLSKAVTPLLKGQGAPRIETDSSANAVEVRTDLSPCEITATDMDFIVRDMGLDHTVVEAWVASSRMLRDAMLRFTDEHAAQQATLHDYGWPFFYSLARQRLARDVDAVLRESADKWQQAWRAARAANRVPALDEEQINPVVDALQLLQRLQQLDPVHSGNSDFARVLTNTPLPLPTAVALDALTIFQKKRLEDTDAFLKLVDRHPEAEAPIKTFVRGVRVHQLVSGHEGLSRLLNARLEGESDSIAPLAAMPSAEWLSLTDEASVSPGLALRMLAKVEKQHPLTALQAKIDSGDLKLPGVSSKELKSLCKEQGETVDTILRGSKPANIAAVNDASAAHKMLRDVGRFVRTGVNMETAGHLISAGVATPAVAIRYGRETIREMVSEIHSQEAAAGLVDGLFEVVEPVLAGANGFMIDVVLNRRAPAFMREKDTQQTSNAALAALGSENLPSLPGFFGDLDECICKPCESMLGQSAYLVDLLNLLRKSTGAFELLDARRPNISKLKLNCENTEKIIQHIDIVLEILEKAAAPGAAPGANVEEIQQIVYANLGSEIFPWNLPFDRGYAETRGYLAKLGVTRLDLLTLGAGIDEKLLAAETLTLSMGHGAISEWGLVTQSRSGDNLWKVYGFTPDGAGRVSLVDPASGEQLNDLLVGDEVLVLASVLLDRTRLELDELEQVLATEFVAGFVGGLHLSNRNQCKTSAMRVPAEGSVLEDCLDRLHRFVRLRAKLLDWSIPQLGKTIKSCNGIETGTTTDQDRENLLVNLGIIKRLHDNHGISIECLIDLPASIDKLRQSLGLSALQFALLKTITTLDLTTQPINWATIEDFCNTAKRIRESGLSVQQVAETLLTRDQLIALAGELPPSIKTDEQIEDLLKAVQRGLRAVVVTRSDVILEAQTTEALAAIFDATTAGKLVKAIRDAGAKDASVGTPDSALVDILSAGATHKLGEWLPLLSNAQTIEILTVVATNNPDANIRFELLLNGIASRRRERVLITVIAEQCGLTEIEVSSLLGTRLLLLAPSAQVQDPVVASNAFLDASFWADVALSNPPAPPVVTINKFPLLHAWMDRLYRLVTLSTVLKLDSELMYLADRVTVGPRIGTTDAPRIGINWRELLAWTPIATSAWYNPNWLALLDMMWLQQPEQLSRPVLNELLNRLAVIDQGAATEVALRPLASRVEISETQTLSIAGQAVSVSNARNLRDPAQLRRAFELLLLARHLGADGTQLTQLANSADNTQSASTAKSLLQVKVGEQAWPAVLQRIDDQLRQQRRDALVAYLIHNNANGLSSVNDLYEHYLIDPQMEPCFETTRILEAITAIQLFAQRILFGIEPGISASTDLKNRWTWMRNYRVWEANRKVFLFPENWMFPELRDDKSSSFKQLESALGQGELTQGLALRSFGQFLDDVAQMGQVEVLGMYEDIARDGNGNILGDLLPDGKKLPKRRTLYVIGRTLNPPYAYFWRDCEDFGSPYMEWLPWQRIELDIQGDHVMPFMLGGELHIAWPLIRRIKNEPKDDLWEIKLAWSRYDGKSWRKSSVSRDFWSDKAAAFSDERRGFAFRCEQVLDGSAVKIRVYALSNDVAMGTKIDPTPSDDRTDSVWDDSEKNPIYAHDENAALEFLKALVSNDGSYNNLPPNTKYQMRIYEAIKINWLQPGFAELDNMSKPIIDWGRSYIFQFPKKAIDRYEYLIGSVAPLPDHNLNDPPSKYYRGRFIEEFRNAANWDVNVPSQKDFQYFNYFYNTLKSIASRRVVKCKAWIKLKAPDTVNTFSFLELKGVAAEGNYSCMIGDVPIDFVPDKPNPMEWKLGGQAAINCTLTLTVKKITPATESSPASETQIPLVKTLGLPAIDASKETTQYLYFEIDASEYNAIEIGFDLDAMKKLLPVSEFHLTRDDMVARFPATNQNELYNPVNGSRPWMNGFREIASRQISSPVISLQIDNPPSPSSITVFDSTRPSQFWVVGAATSKEDQHTSDMLPMAWHYSENGVGCYIDLGYAAQLADSGFIVCPDSYQEATRRRSHWSEFESFEDPALQNSPFGAKELPDPKIGTTEIWDTAKSGAFAFDTRLPYACYNWEVFLHAPLLIADQLSKQHKFEDAERWLRFVFDPTSDGPEANVKRFLKFRVFRDMDLSKQVIDDLTALAQVAGGFGDATSVKTVRKLIDRWRDAPFRPFLIARRRPIAFLWQTLFAYLNNLIAWADSLYRRDTIESINEATMLYVLAEQILGRRPQLHEGSADFEGYSYEDLDDRWDEFANFWIDTGMIVRDSPPPLRPVNGSEPSPNGILYFCMPFNDKIFSYWNIIESRLSNVRNCRNIEGIKRKLPLMDAKIDPELLIRATAAGLDLSDVISGLYAPLPHYRYSILSAHAAELTNEAKALAAAMLSAIEKRDAEHLAQLRSSNEISLLRLVREVRTLQITEAEGNIEALRGSRESAASRYSQYQRLLGKKDIRIPAVHERSAGQESMLGRVDAGSSGLSYLGLIDAENQQIEHLDIAYGWTVAGGITKGVAGATHMSASIVRATSAGAAGTASEVLTSIGTGLATVGDMFDLVSRGWQHGANRQSILGGHLRRRDEWAFQSNQTLKEMQQIDKQILANQIRIDITRKELDNHLEQIEQAKAVDEVMRSKFSNEQLYEWMRTQLYGLYSSTYRMALEMARRAERAAARELGVKPLNILRNDYWDSLRDGLLAGERLHQDIKRLEVAYLDQNRREYELTKHISLRRLDPEALVNLRIKDGDGHCSCEFDLPEWLFDLDTPGHYLRRIKSVSVSIPGVVGPFTSVNCKLTLLKSQVRDELTATHYLRVAGEDSRFTDYFGATEAIVTSTGSGDSGLFETQLRDERFLPFEGGGVISTWRLELPGEYPQFDYSTISDVMLSIRYTSRDGGDDLRGAAITAIGTRLIPTPPSTAEPLRFPVVLSCRSDFPTEWARARMDTGVKIPLTRNLLPYWMYAANLVVREVRVANLTKQSTNPLDFKLVWPRPTGVTDPAPWPADALNEDGVGKGNLGSVANVTDKILLLSVGKRALVVI